MKNTKGPEAAELAAAAASTLERIDQLTREVAEHPKVVAMLAHIRHHLFEPQLSIGHIRKACRIRDNSVALSFHRQVGSPPHAFITECRMAVADRLLSSTLMPIWKITESLGYSSIQVFSRAYQRTRGKRPKVARRESEAIRKTLPTPLPAITEPSLLEEALAGRLGPQAAGELIHKLLDIYLPRERNTFAVDREAGRETPMFTLQATGRLPATP